MFMCGTYMLRTIVTCNIILLSQCSLPKQLLRIFGGEDAKSDKYPYVVRIEIQRQFYDEDNSITYDQQHLCTASALSPVWALSAAHCFDNLGDFYYGTPYTLEKLVIRHGHVNHLPGIHDSFSDVLFTVVNPLYISYYILGEEQKMSRHDIGLLKTNPMNIKSYVKLSAVDYKCFYGYKAVFAGFGIMTKISDKTITIGDTLTLNKPLQIFKVVITKCYEPYLGLCIVSKCDGASITCGGDSGGPLLHPSGLIGVLSQGPPSGLCLDANEMTTESIVGYITPVTPYIEWICNTMKLN